MLSRVAESLFWIGRYLERADGTARVLDVHLQLVLEDPLIDEDTACRALLAIMGIDSWPGGALTVRQVVEILASDRASAPSIAYSLVAARENARRAREIISVDLWECLNTIITRLPAEVAADRYHAWFSWVRERAAMASGITDTTMSRDEPYQFFILGQSLERADMTARLLATRSLTRASAPSWTTILRSCGAWESCLRTYRGLPGAHDAAEFLLLDPLFPRSVLFSMERALGVLAELDPQGRREAADGAGRVLGRAVASLRYRAMSEILADLPEAMDQIQAATSTASDAVKGRFFPSEAMPVWMGEMT
ncbi:MAG: alpha-E domain-containing protein [Bifidobacteriaceae bacterium]|jgi:uncharacterized alpha-E superfamily protein|nr:alpha-E domain-containing protein [Bifidobacteriaceae bacterium]